MNDLLKLALEAHGGLGRWNKVRAIKVAAPSLTVDYEALTKIFIDH